MPVLHSLSRACAFAPCRFQPRQGSDELGGRANPRTQAPDHAGKGRSTKEVRGSLPSRPAGSGRHAQPRPASPALPLRRSDFLKAYQYVNTVKQFRDREVVSQVRRYVHMRAARACAFEVAGARC